VQILVLNGPINAGKTTTGRALATLLPGALFIDGDDHEAADDAPLEQRIEASFAHIEQLIATTQAGFIVVAVPLRDVYSQLDAPILIMLACLIPVADSLQSTGGTDVIANWLSATASVLPGWGALALIMVAAMAVTPFLNNAATVLVMAPIAATFATDLGYQPEAFLLAVAIGAGCDFLTPIGHQCNTLVMGPGGYKFGDYWRLGLPLSIIVVIVAVPMLMLVWPF